MPNHIILEAWARDLRRCFDGEMPYLVGSGIKSRDYRDVDVRIIVPRAKWEAWFGEFQPCMRHNKKWASIMIAMSLWGQRITGLPIDFQVQCQEDVNKYEDEKPREPLCDLLDPEYRTED